MTLTLVSILALMIPTVINFSLVNISNATTKYILSSRCRYFGTQKENCSDSSILLQWKELTCSSHILSPEKLYNPQLLNYFWYLYNHISCWTFISETVLSSGKSLASLLCQIYTVAWMKIAALGLPKLSYSESEPDLPPCSKQLLP